MVSESKNNDQSDKIANLPQVIYMKYLREAFMYCNSSITFSHLNFVLYLYKINTFHLFDVKLSLEYANFLTKIKTHVR